MLQKSQVISHALQRKFIEFTPKSCDTSVYAVATPFCSRVSRDRARGMVFARRAPSRPGSRRGGNSASRHAAGRRIVTARHGNLIGPEVSILSLG